MNLSIVFQPGGKPLDAFYASVLYKRSKCQRFVTGLVQIAVGTAMILTEMAILFMRAWGHEIGTGFWCGPFVLTSGALAIKAHLSQTSNDKLNSYIAGVLCICPFSVVTILVGVLGLANDITAGWVRVNSGINVFKISVGLAAIVCSGVIITRVGRKGDVVLLAQYREKLAAVTREVAEEVSDTLRRTRRPTIEGTISRNSISLCDEQAYPVGFTVEFRREYDLNLEEFEETRSEDSDRRHRATNGRSSFTSENGDICLKEVSAQPAGSGANSAPVHDHNTEAKTHEAEDEL